jgi:hypothetical protein
VSDIPFVLARANAQLGIRYYFLLLCNAPGLLVAVIPFALGGGFTRAHGGEAVVPAFAALLIGNPIGFGFLAYLWISLRHRGENSEDRLDVKVP